MHNNLAHNAFDDLVHIATLKKPYGIKGWLWVFSHTQNRSDIFAMSPWYLKTATGLKSIIPTNWRKQGSGLVASFDIIPDRNIAETMNGATIWVDKNALASAHDDEYLWSDLIGMSVINESGQLLGVVQSLFETGAHDIIDVAPSANSIDNTPRLIPWHKQTVLNIVRKTSEQLGVIYVAWPDDY